MGIRDCSWEELNEWAIKGADYSKECMLELINIGEKNKQFYKLLGLLDHIKIRDLYCYDIFQKSPSKASFLLAWTIYGNCSDYVLLPEHEVKDTEYTADLYIKSKTDSIPFRQVIIEIEDECAAKADIGKERILMELGCKIVRFTSSEMINDGKACIEQLMKIIKK